MKQSINVLALARGARCHVFLYDDASPAVVLRTLGKFASDPDHSLTWYDAAILSQKVRRPHLIMPTTPVLRKAQNHDRQRVRHPHRSGAQGGRGW